MFDTRFFKRADFVLIGVVLALVVIGCLMIYSCTRTGHAQRGVSDFTTLKMQLAWVGLGLIALVVTMSFDYTRLSSLHIPIYIVTIALLAVVLIMPPVRGTHRWIVLGPIRIQPAEFAQLSIIITVAALAAAKERIRDFLAGLRCLVWVLPAVGLIIVEPDLGTPVVILVIWGAILYMCGMRWSHLAGFASAGGLLFLAAWFSGVIQPHQKARLLSFLHPDDDPTGQGYHLFQSLIAIGHGGFFGLGLFKGTQTRLHYIPDQQTDFIFTAVAEELGFIGGVLVIALFGVLLWRCTTVVLEAKDTLGRLLAAGVTALMGIHVIVNIGMTMGLMPVKGMPLPLVSYGGSSMLCTMIAIGLVESVHMRRHKIAF